MAGGKLAQDGIAGISGAKHEPDFLGRERNASGHGSENG